MRFPITTRGIEETIKREALTLPAPKDMARRAGIRLTATPGGGQNIAASFTLIDDELGHVEDHGDDLGYFPSDLPQMDRLLDWRGFTEALLLVTVTQAGAAGTSIGIESADVAFAGGLSVPLDEGVQISEWKAIEFSSDAVLSRWRVYNPSELAGSFGIGLCQLQVR